MGTQLKVFVCECGKMHCCIGVWRDSVCVCGMKLWDYMWKVTV